MTGDGEHVLVSLQGWARLQTRPRRRLPLPSCHRHAVTGTLDTLLYETGEEAKPRCVDNTYNVV